MCAMNFRAVIRWDSQRSFGASSASCPEGQRHVGGFGLLFVPWRRRGREGLEGAALAAALPPVDRGRGGVVGLGDGQSAVRGAQGAFRKDEAIDGRCGLVGRDVLGVCGKQPVRRPGPRRDQEWPTGAPTHCTCGPCAAEAVQAAVGFSLEAPGTRLVATPSRAIMAWPLHAPTPAAGCQESPVARATALRAALVAAESLAWLQRANYRNTTLSDGIHVGSIGSPKWIVPVESRAALYAIRPNGDALASASRKHGVNGAYVYCPDTVYPTAQAHARAFNPLSGSLEDRATGAAAGALAWLLRGATAKNEFRIEQGLALGPLNEINVRLLDQST